jgi:hypothetical protein
MSDAEKWPVEILERVEEMNITTEQNMTTPQNPIFDIEDKQGFRAQFDRSSFMLSHRLASHPLFAIDRLFELVKTKKANGGLYWDMGDIQVNQRWNEAPAKALTVEEALQRIEKANAWLVMRAVQTDPEYRKLMEDSMAEVEECSGVDFKRFVKLKDSIIFITSPRRISTYHIDRECSMLLQIHGEKVIHVFDRADRSVLPEDEIERFWTVDNNAARYREQYQHKAATYQLAPGKAVHIPVNAPHWVKNGNEVSISLNINFHYHDFVKADLYRANYLLRRLGLRPSPPGRSPMRDVLKRRVIGKPITVAKMLKAKLSSPRDH